MNEEQTKMQKYDDIQAFVQKEIEAQFPRLYEQYADRFGVSDIPLHYHTGLDAPQVKQSDVIPSLRASGNITMATNGQTYKLGTTFNPTSVWFYGLANHTSAGTVDIRAHVVGNAQLGPSFYFQPTSATEVTTGGPIQNIIQSSTYFADGTGGVRALSDEGHIVDVEYPTAGTIVARATVSSYGPGYVLVDVVLASGWQIIGNFLVT